MFEAIREAFLRTKSIDRTVEETGINEYKVRRALLTLGLWESGRSREVKALMEMGLSKQQIADKLHLTIKGLESYMPYSRGAYLLDETQDSVDSKNYRERMRTAKGKQVKTMKRKGGNTNMNDFEELRNLKVHKIKLSLETHGDELEVLRKYGKAKDGITRTILVPSSMQLNRLNYVIQKCFGWENSHLHRFVLGDEDFKRITGNDLEKWKSLAGKVFRCHFADGGNDDYYRYWNFGDVYIKDSAIDVLREALISTDWRCVEVNGLCIENGYDWTGRSIDSAWYSVYYDGLWHGVWED